MLFCCASISTFLSLYGLYSSNAQYLVSESLKLLINVIEYFYVVFYTLYNEVLVKYCNNALLLIVFFYNLNMI